MKNRRVFVSLLCIFLLAGVFNVWATGGSQSSSVPTAGSGGTSGYQWPRTITMLGASAGGNAVLSIGAIAQVVSKYAPTTATAQVTAGANQNMYLFDEGEGSYGWGSGNTIEQAVKGLETFTGKPIKTQITMVCEYSASIRQVAVRKGSGINNMQDLKGKRVVVGAAGGGTEADTRFLTRCIGLHDGNNYLFRAEYSGVQEGCDMIANNQADATFISGTIPFSAFSELFLSDKIELIGFTEAEVKTITDANAAFSPATIPAGSYDGKVPATLLSVQDRAGLCAIPTAPDEEVYNIVKILHEHWDELGVIHGLFTQQKAQDMVPLTRQAPIHPGALKYYREKGWVK